MTKRAAVGGQSLLISGALKMARGKKTPNNIVNPNSLRHDMNTINNRELQEAIADSHNNSHNNHTMNLSLTHNHLHLNPSESSSSQGSPTRSTSGFASPASSLQQEPIILTNQTMLTTNNNSQTREQHKQQNNLQQINGKNKKLFPQKLWDLINDERYNFCLRWSDDGQLVYLNRDEFEDSYLKTTENQFHTQKAISFVRQMNMYGFRKVDDCYYENDNFKRGCEHLLKNMTRKHPNKTTTVTTSTTSTTSATGAVNPATSDSNLPHFLYQKSTSSNEQQQLNLHQPQVSEQLINQFHQQQQQQQQQQAQLIDCTMQQQRPFNSAGVNGAAIDSLVSLLNRSANNSTITSRPMQSMPELHQPIDLQCATRQFAPDNTHLQSAASNPNSQQDLNRLIESLATMSREQQLFNAVQLFMLLLQNSETV